MKNIKLLKPPLTIIFLNYAKKVHTLARVAPYINISKRRILMNAFLTSQFSYCPLIWMYYSRTSNRKIKKRHERCLRIIYNEKQSSFEELLQKLEHPYNFRHIRQFKMPSVNTAYHDTESVPLLGPTIWEILHDRLKKMKNVEAFKRAIKIQTPEPLLVDFISYLFKILVSN